MKTLKETSPDIHSRRRGKPTSSLIYTRPKQNPGEESLGTFQGRLGAQTAQCKLSFSEELPALGLPLTDAASPRAGAEEATQRLKVAGTLENNHSPTTRTATLPPSGKVHQKEQETETRTQARQAPSHHSCHNYLGCLLPHRLALPFFSALPQDGGSPAARAATNPHADWLSTEAGRPPPDL